MTLQNFSNVSRSSQGAAEKAVQKQYTPSLPQGEKHRGTKRPGGRSSSGPPPKRVAFAPQEIPAACDGGANAMAVSSLQQAKKKQPDVASENGAATAADEALVSGDAGAGAAAVDEAQPRRPQSRSARRKAFKRMLRRTGVLPYSNRGQTGKAGARGGPAAADGQGMDREAADPARAQRQAGAGSSKRALAPGVGSAPQKKRGEPGDDDDEGALRCAASASALDPNRALGSVGGGAGPLPPRPPPPPPPALPAVASSGLAGPTSSSGSSDGSSSEEEDEEDTSESSSSEEDEEVDSSDGGGKEDSKVSSSSDSDGSSSSSDESSEEEEDEDFVRKSSAAMAGRIVPEHAPPPAVVPNPPVTGSASSGTR